MIIVAFLSCWRNCKEDGDTVEHLLISTTKLRAQQKPFIMRIKVLVCTIIMKTSNKLWCLSEGCIYDGC